MQHWSSLFRQVHRTPELSGFEKNTAANIVEFFELLQADKIDKHLGGNGLAVHFAGKGVGPTLLLRAELDALPISEQTNLEYRSQVPNVAHLCGHDGHMAILANVGEALATRRPARGNVILLFQPAEETGTGAHAVLGDPRFENFKPDYAFAIHNLPGIPLGTLAVRKGTMNAASRGMCILLRGAEAHAAQPETGNSPGIAISQLIQRMSAREFSDPMRRPIKFVTVVGAEHGQKAFGTLPGFGQLWLTLRSETDADMEALVRQCEQCAVQVANENELGIEITFEDIFDATINHDSAVNLLKSCCSEFPAFYMTEPLRWSEDFGRFTQQCPGALIGLGAGEATAALHHPTYVFPETLIPIGAELLCNIIQSLNGWSDESS